MANEEFRITSGCVVSVFHTIAENLPVCTCAIIEDIEAMGAERAAVVSEYFEAIGCRMLREMNEATHEGEPIDVSNNEPFMFAVSHYAHIRQVFKNDPLDAKIIEFEN